EGAKHRLEQRGVTAEVVRSGVSPAELAGASGLTATGAIPLISPAEESTPAGGNRGNAAGLNLLYVGTVGRSQDLRTSIRAMAKTEGVRLRLVGDGADVAALRAVAGGHHVSVGFPAQHARAQHAPHWECAVA